MNDDTLKLLEKALAASPDDWEMRSHLIDHYLSVGSAARAGELLAAAPTFPETEENALRQARVELETSPDEAIATLQEILARNRACAQAYLLFARLYMKRGLHDEARKKYGAATVIDESLHDPELERWLNGGRPAPETAPPPAERSKAPAEETPAEPTESSNDLVAITAEETASALEALNEADYAQPPQTTFGDVAGMDDVIERIRMNIIYPFKNQELFRKFNRKPGGGILMYGPPGCGKTHIARATAGECGATFITVAITDILSKYLGESERHLHEFFETARRRSPAVIFIDEVDAIGVSRADAGSYQAPLVNVFLSEMDGIASRNDSVLVLAATNAPWRVDGALRRPGRFDRVLFVPPPDAAARKAILRIHLRDLPCEPLDLDKVARATDRFSGADLRGLVVTASEKAIHSEMRTGKPAKITQAWLIASAKELRASTNEWLETARSYATYANRAGLYDELVEYFKKS